MRFVENPFFLLALTLGVYQLAKLLQHRTRSLLLNPILVSIALLILFLKLTDVPFEAYQKAGGWIEFWLRPAVVALGVPLYLQLNIIRKQVLPILLSQLAGCVVGIVSVVSIARWLGASPTVLCSLAPKSVTTPIAMEVSQSIGGIPSLTAAVVVCVGLFGGICGFKAMHALKVHNPIAQGLSIGLASHAVGASAAMSISHRYGGYAGVGLILNGILTAMLTSPLLHLLGVL